MLFIMPMWMNSLLRIIAWQNILERKGVLNTFLELLHLPTLNIINSPAAKAITRQSRVEISESLIESQSALKFSSVAINPIFSKVKPPFCPGVTSLIFKGVHYEMEVKAGDFEWLVHSTDMAPVGSEVGIRVDPFKYVAFPDKICNKRVFRLVVNIFRRADLLEPYARLFIRRSAAAHCHRARDRQRTEGTPA